MQQAATIVPLVAVFGAIIGSFLNVVALRWYGNRGLRLGDRSACPHCGRVLRWFELIPVLSYFTIQGRCRSCGKRISRRYPAVELVTGAVFGLIVYRYGVSAPSAILLALSALLTVLLLVDLEHLLLPDELTAATLGVMLLGIAWGGFPMVLGLPGAGLGAWWLGGVVGGGILGTLYFLTRGRGMGLGDVKLAAVLGLSLGGSGALMFLGLAFTIGAGIGIALLLMRRAGWKSEVPFGPFLIASWWVMVFWGGDLLAWYTQLAF